MNVENITIEQKNTIKTGIQTVNNYKFDMDVANNIHDFNKYPQIVKDVLIIADKLAFLSGKDYEDVIHDDGIDYDLYFDFIGFFEIMIKLRNKHKKLLSETFYTSLQEVMLNCLDLEPTIYGNIDLLLLFKSLAYLEFNKLKDIKILRKINRAKIIKHHNIAHLKFRFYNLTEVISEIPPAKLAALITQDNKRKHIANFLVEQDYLLCKENNLNVYKKDLQYLKDSNHGNLARTATGREIIKWLRQYLFDEVGFKGNYFRDSKHPEAERKRAEDLIMNSWVKTVSKLI